MNNPPIKPYALKYGVIIGLFLFVYGAFFAMSRLPEVEPGFWESNGAYLVLGLALFLMFKEYRDNNGKLLTYGRGVKLGTATVLLSCALSAVLNYFYVVFVDDSIVQQQLEIVEQLEQTGSFTDEEISQMKASTKPPILQIGLFIFTSIMGILQVFIMAAIMQRKALPQEQE